MKLKQKYKDIIKNSINGIINLNEEILIGEDDEESKKNKNILNVPVDFQHKILFEIGKEQLIYVYNNVLVPYYTYIQSRFFGTENIQLLQAYIYFDKLTTQLIQVRKKNISPEATKDIQNLIDVHKSINDTIKKNHSSIDISPVKIEDEIEDIKIKIDKNGQTISKIFNALIAPAANGYKSLLDKIEKELNAQVTNTGLPNAQPQQQINNKNPQQQINNKNPQQQVQNQPVQTPQQSFRLYSKSQYYLNFDELFKGIQHIYFQDQFQIILKNYNNIEHNIYGTWFKSKFQNVVNGINTQIKNIKGGIQPNLQQLKNSVKNTNNSVQDIHTTFDAIFEKISQIFVQYDRSLLEFISTLDFSDYLYEEGVDTKSISKDLQQSDRGFFNQDINKVVKRFSLAIVEYEKKHKFESEEEEKNKKGKATEPTNVEEYINYYLGFEKENHVSNYDKEYLKIIALSQEDWDRKKSIIEKVGEYSEKAKIREILKEGIQPVHSYIDLIQKWFVVAYPNEIQLYGANKYTIEDLIEKLQSKENEEEKDIENYLSSEVDSLYRLLENKHFEINTKHNGHTIQWKPNNGTTLLLNSIKADDYISYLSNKKKEFFDALFFTDEYFKKLVYTDNGEEHYKTRADIINPDDIAKSLKKTGSKNKNNEEDFTDVFKDYGFGYTFNQQQQEKTNSTSIKNLANNFNLNDIQKKDSGKDHIVLVSDIGLIITEFFNSFINKYGDKFNITEFMSPKEKSEKIIPLLIKSTGKKYDKSQIDETKTALMRIFKFYGSKKTYDKIKQDKNPGGNWDIQYDVANILNILKNILKGELK